VAVTQQLQHLAGAYFHQDYDLDEGSPEAFLDAFMSGEGQASVAELVSEIDRLLASPVSEAELYDLWIGDWHASYSPRDDGQTMRGWLAQVRKRVSERAL
jgi:hypothetical protein